MDIPFVGLDIIPFSEQLPEFDRTRTSIFYGSTTFSQLAFSDPETRIGVFFDPVAFSIERYLQEWGEEMLNHGAKVMTFEELMNSELDPKKLLFIRPDDDGKAFAGEVVTFGEIVDWFEKAQMTSNSGLTIQTRVVVGEPYNIGREWRLWCVNKKVVAASQYRNRFKLDKQQGCPEEVKIYAESRCLQYTPHDVFVMDVCESAGKLYIVECNCMNAAGFYHADIGAIVEAVSDYVASLK